MIYLTEEEYGMLRATPAWNTFIDQLTKEIHRVAMDMADGELLSVDAEATAINYSAASGRTQGFIEIVNYRPGEGEEEEEED